MQLKLCSMWHSNCAGNVQQIQLEAQGKGASHQWATIEKQFI